MCHGRKCAPFAGRSRAFTLGCVQERERRDALLLAFPSPTGFDFPSVLGRDDAREYHRQRRIRRERPPATLPVKIHVARSRRFYALKPTRVHSPWPTKT